MCYCHIEPSCPLQQLSTRHPAHFQHTSAYPVSVPTLNPREKYTGTYILPGIYFSCTASVSRETPKKETTHLAQNIRVADKTEPNKKTKHISTETKTTQKPAPNTAICTKSEIRIPGILLDGLVTTYNHLLEHIAILFSCIIIHYCCP